MNYELKYMQRCIQLAKCGEMGAPPNPMVGAVIVCNGEIIGEGYHRRCGGPHAEVNCFTDAERRGVTEEEIHEATLYVSLEPCSHYGKTPPCAKLIIEKGVGHVVVGMLDPNPLVAGKGVQMLRDAGIDVTVGVMEKECRELNKRFLCLHEKHRPYVILKWAQTADGFVDRKRKISLPFREESEVGLHLNGALAISTPLTKKLVHRMRAENMAIMVGTNTVLLDNPRLLNTHWEGRNPIRVTVDRHNRIPANARILSDETGENETIVYRERTDWPYILGDLAKRNIHSILVEGGTTLLTHIIDSGLWDEMHIEVAPELTIGTGVSAPKVNLPDTYDELDGHRLYTINHIV